MQKLFITEEGVVANTLISRKKVAIYVLLVGLVISLALFIFFLTSQFLTATTYTYGEPVQAGRLFEYLNPKIGKWIPTDLLKTSSLIESRVACERFADIPVCGSLIATALFCLTLFILLAFVRNSSSRWQRAGLITGAIVVFALVTVTVTVGTLAGLSQIIVHSAHQTIQTGIADLDARQPVEKKGYLMQVEDISTSLREGRCVVTKIEEVPGDFGIVGVYLKDQTPKRTTFARAVVVPLLIADGPIGMARPPFAFLLSEQGNLSVGKYSRQDMNVLLPVLAEHLIRSQYGKYGLESVPNPAFGLLDADLFAEKEKKKEDEFKTELRKIVQEINRYLAQANDAYSHNSGILKDAERYDTKLDSAQRKYVDKLKQEYKTYCTGSYRPDGCKELKRAIDKNESLIAEARAEIERTKREANAANAEISRDRRSVSEELGYIRDLLKDIEEHPTNPEYLLGMFFPADRVLFVKWEDGETKPFLYYLSTGVHEYAHALSFRGEYEWATTLEEAMTEYVATETLAHVVPTSDAVETVTYVDEIRILQFLFAYVSKESLEQLYFTDKSPEKLSEAFKKVITDKKERELLEKKIEALVYVPADDPAFRAELVQSIEDDMKNKQASIASAF